MINRIEEFLKKREILIIIVLLSTMLLVNSRGLSWGLPRIWHPDELVSEVVQVLDGKLAFDQENFDYPSLPKHIMWLIGLVTDSLGWPRASFLLIARWVSVLLGSLVAWMTYRVARHLEINHFFSLIAVLFIITSSEVTLNSHFAHNDMYVMFFTLLTIYLLLKYQSNRQKQWLYLAFFSSGLTASSKYNGGIILIVVMIAYLLVEGNKSEEKKILKIFETYFVGVGLAILGYGLGTPTALLWFGFYMKRLIPALWRHAHYNMQPGTSIGFFKQWQVLQTAFGQPVFWLFIISFIAMVALLALKKIGHEPQEKNQRQKIIIVIMAVVALNIPTFFSYNVVPRFFLPILPLFAVSSAFALEKFYEMVISGKPAWVKGLGAFMLSAILAYSGMRVASVILSFLNDARIPAGGFISALPEGSSIEMTFYQPNVENPERFSRLHSYPLIFLKFEGQENPRDEYFQYNIGEEGIEYRQTDYLVIDSITYNRFKNKYVCRIHQAECDFFNRLMAGKTNYQRIATFSYSLPDFLPRPNLNFLNPTIQVYQRVK